MWSDYIARWNEQCYNSEVLSPTHLRKDVECVEGASPEKESKHM